MKLGIFALSGMVAAVCAVALAAPSYAADSVVNIQLQDATTKNMSDMKMLLDRNVVPAGKVTLSAKNESKQLIHEVIVIKDTGAPLPYDEKAGKVVESQIKSLGEVSDLKPGAAGKKTFDLTPGTYLLICNQAMHMKNGMFARLKVVAAAAGKTAGPDEKTPPATHDVVVAPGGADDEGS
ncbi:MAG TPA: hypothetical protein VNF99_17155 [Stellaceae bacterium]|nr:hypothetical protein [Stellaceae bacterium]